MVSGYTPELDGNPELGMKDNTFYQEIIDLLKVIK